MPRHDPTGELRLEAKVRPAIEAALADQCRRGKLRYEPSLAVIDAITAAVVAAVSE
ncbi:MAG TPA: hypothetical protein VFW23_12520 [Tepidisphaeraceae bacterium]|nr:hypothetical protein [Tepidisphaeraceae bacterium]